MRVDLTQAPIYFEEEAGGGGGAAPSEGAPAAEPVVTQTTTTTEADPFDNPDTDKFDRAYVERLRRESAGHRTAATPFKEAFDGFDPEEQAALLDLVKEIQSNPKTAAKRMAELVTAIDEMYPDEKAPVEGAGTDDQPLTKAQVEEMLADKDRRKQEDAAVESIEKQAKVLGYEKGTSKYVDLLWRAQNETNFDLEAAHKAIEADKQSVIDAYIESKKEGGAPILPKGGEAGTEPKKAGDFTDARARLEARLGAVAGE